MPRSDTTPRVVPQSKHITPTSTALWDSSFLRCSPCTSACSKDPKASTVVSVDRTIQHPPLDEAPALKPFQCTRVTAQVANHSQDPRESSFGEIIRLTLAETSRALVAEYDNMVMRREAEQVPSFSPTPPFVSQLVSSEVARAGHVLSQSDGAPGKKHIVPNILPESSATMSTQTPADWVLTKMHCSKTLILDRNCPRQQGTTSQPPRSIGLDEEKHQRSSVLESLVMIGTIPKDAAMSTKSQAVPWHYDVNMELVMDTFMAGIVMLNTVAMGLSNDIARGSSLWVILDLFFVICFFIEIVFKINLNGFKGFFCGEMRTWNLFDFVVFVMATLEVGVSIINLLQGIPAHKTSLSMVRIVRMCRITRLVRLIRFSLFKDLLMMINGMIGGMRTLFWSMILIVLPLYAVAVLLRDSVGTNKNIDSLDNAMFTVFRCFVSGDCSDSDGRPIVVSLIKESGTLYGIGYCIISLLMTFGLFNVIIALYVENTVAAAKHNDILQRRLRLQDQSRLTMKARELVRLFYQESLKLDPSTQLGRGSGNSNVKIEDIDKETLDSMRITQAMFDIIIHEQSIQELLDDLDIQPEDRVNLFEILDAYGSGSLALEELIVGIIKLRGESRRSDVIAINLQVRELQVAVHTLEARILESIEASYHKHHTHHEHHAYHQQWPIEPELDGMLHANAAAPK